MFSSLMRWVALPFGSIGKLRHMLNATKSLISLPYQASP